MSYPDYVGSWTIESALSDIEHQAETEAKAAARRIEAEDELLRILGWETRQAGYGSGSMVYDHPRTTERGATRARALQVAMDAARMVLRQPKAPQVPPAPEAVEHASTDKSGLITVDGEGF